MERMVRNKQVVLVSYANEGLVTDDHVKIRESQLNFNACKEKSLCRICGSWGIRISDGV